LAATDPELIKRLDDLAVDLVASTPEELARYQRAEIERWAIFVRDAKITVD
jgi:tripartite-type tricarboxylate transporter receptor subunit TctC